MEDKDTKRITKREFGLMLDELLTWVNEWVAFQKSSVDGTIRFINSTPEGDGNAKEA